MRFLLLTIAGACALTVASAAQQPPTALRFEVASVKRNVGSALGVQHRSSPDRMDIVNFSLDSIIRMAYQVPSYKLVGVPSSAFAERFDISLKATRSINVPERLQLLQAVLAERFRLKARYQKKVQPTYVLVRVEPNRTLGPRIRPRRGCEPPNDCSRLGGNVSPTKGVVVYRGTTLDAVAVVLSEALERPVLNETRIEGYYDVDLSWNPDGRNADDPRPSLFTAVQEQLGLKLTVEPRPIEVLVIDSVERPTPD